MVVRALPDAIDLFVVAIRAGLTPELAVRRLALSLAAPVGPGFAAVVARIEDGARFADALESLLDTLGETARPLVAAVTSSERYGLPLQRSIRPRNTPAPNGVADVKPRLVSFP
jgi:Flp pilus assembly protein TadB